MIRYFIAFLFSVSLAACAKAERPLPGDSVAEDGAVTLSPPRLSSAPDPVTTTAEGPIEARLYPPELAMEHQAELGITPEQKTMLIAETEHGHSEVLHAQWELEAEKTQLVKLLDPDQVDEPKTKVAAARVMEKESTGESRVFDDARPRQKHPYERAEDEVARASKIAGERE